MRKEIVDIVVSDVEKIWSSASIPTIEFLLSITMRINVLIDSYLKLPKSAKRDGEKEANKRRAYQNKILLCRLILCPSIIFDTSEALTIPQSSKLALDIIAVVLSETPLRSRMML